jgi:hypothetical protein
MAPAETRILQNQIEIMWTLSYLLKCVKPDLVGKAGELDRMRDDLAAACKHTKAIMSTVTSQNHEQSND